MKRFRNDTTFANFARMVLQDLRKEKCNVLMGSKSKCATDGHIRPFFHSCKYCEVRYDLIGKLEDFEADFAEVLERRGNLSADLAHVQRKNLSPGSGDGW